MPRGKPFQPGSDERRNAGGRPKEVGHVKELAKEQTEKAIATLMEIHADKTQPAPARVAAAQALLDRAWGKPSQAIGGAEDLGPVEMVVKWQSVKR